MEDKNESGSQVPLPRGSSGHSVLSVVEYGSPSYLQSLS